MSEQRPQTGPAPEQAAQTQQAEQTQQAAQTQQAEQTQQAAQTQQPEQTQQPVAVVPRKRGRATVLDMVRSMLVIVAFVGVVLLFAPQPDAVEQPTVDPVNAGLSAAAAGEQLGFAPLLLLAGAQAAEVGEIPGVSAVVDVGAGWGLDYARLESGADDVPTWREGLLSPDLRRVDLEQALDPSEEWLVRADEGRVGEAEVVELGGLSWSRVERGDGRTAYTTVSPPVSGDPSVTTMVSASSDSEDLRVVVELVASGLQD